MRMQYLIAGIQRQEQNDIQEPVKCFQTSESLHTSLSALFTDSNRSGVVLMDGHFY